MYLLSWNLNEDTGIKQRHLTFCIAPLRILRNKTKSLCWTLRDHPMVMNFELRIQVRNLTVLESYHPKDM